MAKEKTSEIKDSGIYILIEDDNERVPAIYKESNDSATKLAHQKRLRSFNELALMHRRYYTRSGKEPRISEQRQAQIPRKKEKLEQVKMKSVWDSFILSEFEGKIANVLAKVSGRIPREYQEILAK